MPLGTHRRTLFAGILGAAVWGAGLPAVAQQPQPPAGTALSGSLELQRLVDAAAARLKIPIEYEPATLKGTIELRSPADLSDDELWTFVGNALAARGFTVVRKEGDAVYSVVKIADAPALVTAGSEPDGPSAGFRSITIRAQHRPTKEVVDALSKLVSKPSGSAIALGDGGLILVSDLSARVEQCVRLLPEIDSPGPAVRVEEIPLRNVAPALLVSSAAQLALKRDAVAGEKAPGDVVVSPGGGGVLIVAPEDRLAYWKGLVQQLDRREAVSTVTYTPPYFPAKDVARLAEQTIKEAGDERWKVVVDDLTGSLVVTATPTQHEAVHALLERLAGAPTEVRRPVRTFVIKNRPVKEIQAVLERLLQAGVIEAGAESTSMPAAKSGTANSDKPVAIAMPPPPTGAAAATGPTPASTSPPAPAAAAGSPYLAQRPREPAAQGVGSGSQTPAERALTLSSDEGTNTLMAVGEPRLLAQVEQLLKALDVRQPQVMLEVLMVTLTESQTLDLGVELDALIKSGDLRIRLSSLFGLSKRGADGALSPGDPSGFSGVVLDPGSFASVIRALQTISHGRSLSMPKLLVGNNQSATLDSILTQPYASVNSTNTIATTSYGGAEPAGTAVTIKPQIAEGDHLVLDYSVSLSSFVGNASAATLPPPKQENKVQSAATIPDGYTVVVGGIELVNDAKSVSQVPLLGNIPVVGELFKTRNNSGNRSRFYVFIRANILRHRGFEDLKYISDRDVVKADVDDGLPKVEPRVIR